MNELAIIYGEDAYAFILNNPHKVKPLLKKVMDEEKQKIKATPEHLRIFAEAKEQYKILMSKNGMKSAEAMFEAFVKKHKKWPEYLPLLKPSIIRQSADATRRKAAGDFVPFPKNFQTWLNQKCWEIEVEEPEEKKHTFNPDLYT